MKWAELPIDEQIKRSRVLFGNGIKVILWDEDILRFFVNHYKAKTIDIAVNRALEEYANLLADQAESKSQEPSQAKQDGATTTKSIKI